MANTISVSFQFKNSKYPINATKVMASLAKESRVKISNEAPLFTSYTMLLVSPLACWF